MPTSPSMRSRIADERGFTLMEILIAMILVGILMALAIPTFFGAREATSANATRAAASEYAAAISAFRLDHANRNPVVGSADWPNPQRGPVDRNGTPYMSEVPQLVAEGLVNFCANSCGAGQEGKIEYVRAGDDSGFFLRVHTKDNRAIVQDCGVGSGMRMPGLTPCGSKR